MKASLTTNPTHLFCQVSWDNIVSINPAQSYTYTVCYTVCYTYVRYSRKRTPEPNLTQLYFFH